MPGADIFPERRARNLPARVRGACSVEQIAAFQELAEITLRRVASALPQIATGVFVFLVFWLGSVLLGKAFVRLASHSDPSRYVVKLAAKTVQVAVLIFGVLTGLGTMGLDVSALVAGLGLTGFALGFALRDVLSNLLSGLLILFYQPFRHYDYVVVAGFEGIVTQIDLRYTTLQKDGREILIPNSLLFTNGLVKSKEPPPKVPDTVVDGG